MHPWLIGSGPVLVPTYLTCLMAGAVVATFVLAREIRRSPLPRRDLYDLALLALPAGFLGARAFLVLEDPARYLADPWRLLVGGGWVFYGAMLGPALALSVGAAWRGLPPWAVLDVFTPALPFGMTLGRLGCLGAGCCHGRPADWPWGLEVPWAVRYYRLGHVPEPLLGVPLHPSPLYESALALLLFVWTTRVARRVHFEGEVVLTLLLGYGAGRFVLEWFRGDLERGTWGGGLSTAQGTALTTMVVCAVLWRGRRRACSRS